MGIFGWNLKKTIAIFVISTLEFFNMRSLNLDEIYEKKAKGIRIRSKCNWYEHGEKSTKFFLNLEKHRAIQSQIHSVIINQDEITDQDEINKQIFSFYQSLFQ